MSDTPDDIFALIEADETGLPIQVAVDPDSVPVFLSQAVWVEHIVVNHVSVYAVREFILSAISNPTERLFEDVTQRTAKTWFLLPDEFQISITTERYILVVIKYVYPSERHFERTGLVSTAYIQSRVFQ
jgi:hypothetical protein